MSYGEVRIDPPVAASGLLQWEAAAAALRAQVAARVAAVRSAHSAAPWGRDGAGSTFSTAYLESAPGVLDAVPDGVARLADLGDNAATAIQASLDSDAAQATAVTVEVDSGL